MIHMKPESTISQSRQECEAWKRTLDFLMQENVFLKNRLAEKINLLEAGHVFVGDAEQLYQTLIRNDEMLHFLRGDVSKMQLRLEGKLAGTESAAAQPDLQTSLNALRRDMMEIGRNFNEVQFRFNTLFGNLS